MVDDNHMGQCCLPWACTLRKEYGSGFVDSGAIWEETDMCHCFVHHILCEATQFWGENLCFRNDCYASVLLVMTHKTLPESEVRVLHVQCW